jgi:hypothetical protein
MSAVSAKVIVPSFTVDTRGVGIVDQDYSLGDLGNILAQPRVHDEALALYRLSPAPAVAFVCGPGPGRALPAHLRIGGLRALHIDDGNTVDAIRQIVADLVAGKLDVVTSVNRLAGAQPIPGLHAAMLLRSTRLPETHLRQLGRLQPASGEVTIYDLVGNVARHGLPAGWSATTIVGPAVEVIRDPYIDKLADVPHRTAMAWAGKNVDRLVLIQRAKNFKPGWVYNAVKSFDPGLADRWWRAQKHGPWVGGDPTRPGRIPIAP